MHVCLCRSRVHDWALDHTLEVHFDGQKMNTFHLRKSLWMAGAMDESQDDMEEHHVQSSVEELAEWKLEGYFKEKTLDRDMDYLRAVDPGITNSMTVASGRLYWHSNWDQERAMFVAVPSKRNRYYAPTTRNKTLPQTKTPTPRDSFDSSEWWAKPAIESGMHETSPYLLRFLVEHIWNVRRPKLVLTITGGADEFQLAVGLKDEILRGLMDVAKSMQAWIITGGSASGIMRYVGEAHAKEGAQVPLIGIIPWGSVSGRQGLLATPSDSRIRPPTEQLPQDYEECVRAFEELTDKWHDSHREVERPSSRVARLDHNHTHFILVKDGQSHRYGTEIPLRTAFEACVTSHTSYTREILRMLNDQKLGWQGMNVEKIRNKDVLQEGPQGSRAIPAVCVCIEGGSSSIATVASAARNRLPVVIVKKTGRAADLLADVGDIYDPGVERNTDRMNLVNRAFELLDSLDNVDHLGTPEMGEHDHEVAEAVLDALDAYGLKDPSTKTSEQAALLFQCRDAVCTGRCFVVDYDEDTQSISDLNGAILESILWGWGSDIHEAQRATLNGQPSGTRVSDPLMKFPDSKWSAKRHQGIKYSRELFLKKLIIIVQWDRPDLLRNFLEDIPPKSSSSEQVYRGMETVWQQALDAALEEAIISRQGRQTELVKVLLEHGADLDIFKVDQRRLCNQLVEVPEIKHVLEREQQELVASMRNSSRHRREPATSLSRERSSLEKLELTLEDKDVLAASRWTRLMGVRKRWQDARHLIAMMHRSKNKLIETSRKMRQFVDQEHGSKTTGNASTEQGVLNKDAQAMLRIASIKASFLRSSISDEGSNKVRRQNALGMLVKLARTLIKVDRLFADSLGPQFRYKLGMMDPQWDLMLWSVLVNRTELAVFFWERASQPVVSALTAIHLYRAIKGDVRPEMRDDIDSAVQDFENRAVNVQQEAMGEDIRLSLQYLECPLLMWGGWTGYDLAVDSNCREFVTKCCRQAHHERWYGDMMQMDVAAVARWHLPISVCLMIYVAFFPMFWVTLAFSVGHHYTHISPEGVDATEAMLKENSCFPYPLSPWGLTRHETKTVLWVVTASLLPVLLVAPLCIQPINHMGWRVPPVSESLRPPGQLRNIPQGYPSEPFINPHLVTYYSYLVGRAVAKDLRSTGNMSCISYHWVSVRQILRFWLQRTWSMFLSHEETTEEVKERQLLRTQSFYKGKHQTLSKLGADIDSILEHVSDAVRKDFLECMSLDGGEPTISELEYYVGKKAARTREAKFIKWMQTLRKNPDAWDRMSASETAVLWSPSFRYLERLKCFMCAPATVFAMNSVTFASFVLVFTMLVIYPEYAEKPLDFVPWEEVYVIVAMTALLFQELIQIYEGTGFVNYLSEHWNWLDLAGQILFWIGFAMRMNCVFTSSCKEKNHFVLWNCAKSPPLIESCDVEQSEAGMCAQEQLFRGYKGFEYWQLTRQLYSLSCGCCWLRLLHIYSASESLGALVIAIFGMFKDIVVFVAIILICVTGFAVMLVGGRTATDCLPSEDPQAVHGFCLSYWWWLRTYFMGYGEIPLDELQDVVSLVVACVAMLIVHLILMNTAFVAMITSSYDAVMVQSKQTWMINLYNLTEDYIEGHTTIPVPFNLMYHIPRNLFRILSWLTLGKSVQDTAIRMHKRREVLHEMSAFCVVIWPEHRHKPLVCCLVITHRAPHANRPQPGFKFRRPGT